MRLLLSVALAFGLLLSGAVHAAEMSAEEQQILDNLSPELRQDVMDRMGPDQTVTGILRTTLLNNLSQEFGTMRIIDADYTQGVAVIEMPDGEQRTVQFDATTLVIQP